MTSQSPDHTAQLLEAQAQLAAAREPRAAGPGADARTLRTAYLDLLKLCVCDLAGTGTTSVGAMPGGEVMSRELYGQDRKLRVAGMDWPLHGLTMVGLTRLDDLQRCVEELVADGVEGDLVEAGAWRGGAAILMRATLDTLGEGRTVWVADSFRGFPEDGAPDDGSIDLRAFDYLAVPEQEVRASFRRLGYERGVRFVPGFFRETLGTLAAERWAMVRIDADSYDATGEALRCLYPRLEVGGYLIVDDYGSFEGCRRAVDEFRDRHGIAEPIEKVDTTCVRWRRENAAPIASPAPPTTSPGSSTGVGPPDDHPAARPTPVPTARELELADEVSALQTRLAHAEAQVGLRAWARRRLAGGGRR